MIPGPPDWLDKLATSGPAYIFAFLWFLAEVKLYFANKEFKDFFRETLQTNIEMKSLLDTIVKVVTGGNRT